LKWGTQLKWFLQLAEDGIIVKPLQTMPKLYDDLLLSWEAFWALALSRPIGFGSYGAIPFSEIASYIYFRGIKNPDVQEEMLFHIRFLDGEYLNLMQDKKSENKDGDRHRGGVRE
jgi:hypothetical protein